MSTIGNETYLNEIANIFMGPFRRFTIKLCRNYDKKLFFGAESTFLPPPSNHTTKGANTYVLRKF